MSIFLSYVTCTNKTPVTQHLIDEEIMHGIMQFSKHSSDTESEEERKKKLIFGEEPEEINA